MIKRDTKIALSNQRLRECDRLALTDLELISRKKDHLWTEVIKRRTLILCVRYLLHSDLLVHLNDNLNLIEYSFSAKNTFLREMLREAPAHL